MRPKAVSMLVRYDGSKAYLVNLQNGKYRWYQPDTLPKTVREWLEWHTADGAVGSIDFGLVYHYYE